MTGEEAKNYEREINYIKEHYEPVEDKPGYVWFNKRNYQIISIETLAKAFHPNKEYDPRIIDRFLD